MLQKTKNIKGKKNKLVAAAMSGGVDSSVAADLLLEEGYEVIGLTMELQKCEQEKDGGNYCKLTSAAADAQKVCKKLGIPHYVINLNKQFNDKVINYFIDEYLQGRTPNPCVACNSYIKFGAMLIKARELGADLIATGHYARIEFDQEKKRYLLYKGKDSSKDQSYFLYTLTQEQLGQMLFPLAQYTKDEIRQKARELGLVTADRAESQEICFIPDNDYKKFLAERVNDIRIKPGKFLNTQGEVIGQHQGVAYYTVGQRKGLGLALGFPTYVIALDPAHNNVIVGTEKEIYQKGLRAVNNNFIAFDKLQEQLEVDVKIRYGAQPAPAVISPDKNGRVLVSFREPQRAITPGQAAVYYQGDMLVGGGTIDGV